MVLICLSFLRGTTAIAECLRVVFTGMLQETPKLIVHRKKATAIDATIQVIVKSDDMQWKIRRILSLENGKFRSKVTELKTLPSEEVVKGDILLNLRKIMVSSICLPSNLPLTISHVIFFSFESLFQRVSQSELYFALKRIPSGH